MYCAFKLYKNFDFLCSSFLYISFGFDSTQAVKFLHLVAIFTAININNFTSLNNDTFLLFYLFWLTGINIRVRK